MNKHINEKALSLIIVIVLQALLTALLMRNIHFESVSVIRDSFGKSIGIVSLAGILSIYALFQIRKIIEMAEKEVEGEKARIRLEEAQELNETLRSHRHDFLNHLQVVGGLMQLGNTAAAQEYLNEVVADLKNVKNIRFVNQPEIDALILKKQAQAQGLGIRFTLDLRCTLEGVEISSTDVARIMGNLLENAIQAVDELPHGEKRVKLVLLPVNNGIVIEVYNNEPIIPKALQEAIFDRGFTTKGASGNGLGLDIVKTLVEKHGGRVGLESVKDKGTTFRIYLPTKCTTFNEVGVLADHLEQ